MNSNFDKITAKVHNYEALSIEKGTKLSSILNSIGLGKTKQFLAAVVNNQIRHLNYEVSEDSNIRFIDITDKDGLRIYIRTLSLIYIKACKDLFNDVDVTIEHSISKGIYSEVHKESKLTLDDIDKIKQKMKEIIASDIDITRELVSVEQAKDIFTAQNMNDKVRLLNHTNKENVHIYKLDKYYDTFYGFLAPSTGYIDKFELVYYPPGIIIQFPIKETNYLIPKFEEQEKLSKIFRESERWGDILDVGYVGSLNDKIDDGSIEDIIRISEALHEKKIAYIADKICENEDVRIILIAGPSSSGKTTFAERLSTQLKVNGKKPISISLDDYFVNREDTPLDENGEYDFESIYSIDLELFNMDLIKLLSGKEVEIPRFNFVTGKREYVGNKIKIDKTHPIIIEGIHGLNEMLTSSIPQKNKFKIYISALTQLNVDSHNRIHTTDTRLIRRMVRDSKYRGYDGATTLKRWDSVRRGEERNIFPFQEEADVMFNSALVYELAVLKKYVEPLLEKIDESNEFYKESKRLLKFMSYFKDISQEESIPCTSIIKEFIGGSCFRKE